MNIEELFENEKWAGYGIVVTDDANQAIDYLKEEVMEYVAGLEKHIAELDLRLGCCRDASAGKDLLIAELEKQLPKVVMPKRWVSRLGDDMFVCPACHRKVKGNLYSHKACQCGAKLNWEK